MTDYMITGLVSKRAELAGDIERAQEALAKLVQDLGHIDTTLRIVAPDMTVEAIRPKAFRPPADLSKRGEMTRMVLDILRTARGPMTTREIGERMILERGIAATPDALNSMTRRLLMRSGASGSWGSRALLRVRRDSGSCGSWRGSSNPEPSSLGWRGASR